MEVGVSLMFFTVEMFIHRRYNRRREIGFMENLDMFNWFRSIMNSGSVLGYFFQAVPITCVVGKSYM